MAASSVVMSLIVSTAALHHIFMPHVGVGSIGDADLAIRID
jgi:hypothetical protein